MNAPQLTVRQVMDVTPVAVVPDCSLREVLHIMNQRRIGSVLVVEGSDQLAGIFTERDLLKRVITASDGWGSIPVSQWMTSTPHTIGPEAGWDEAVNLMDRKRIRHLPVLEGGRLIGIVSTRLLMARRAEYLDRAVEDRTAELKRSYETLMARDSELLHNLRAAGRLQRKVLLPHAPPDWSELAWAVHYAPLDHLGGDYYDFAQPEDCCLGLLIADASGHSVPAALVAIMARFAFADASARERSPGLVLGVVNRRLQELIEERFVSAFYGMLDRTTGHFRYAGAGHPYPLHFSAKTGAVKQLVARGFLLGIMPDEVYEERQIQLEPGDKICFYTDGLIEARNEIGEMYGMERLTEVFQTNSRLPAKELLQVILADQREFSGNYPLGDDLTIAVAEWNKS